MAGYAPIFKKIQACASVSMYNYTTAILLESMCMCKSGFFNLSTTDVLGRIVCSGGLSCACTMLSRIPASTHQLPTAVPHHQNKNSLDTASYALGTPLVENHYLQLNASVASSVSALVKLLIMADRQTDADI